MAARKLARVCTMEIGAWRRNEFNTKIDAVSYFRSNFGIFKLFHICSLTFLAPYNARLNIHALPPRFATGNAPLGKQRYLSIRVRIRDINNSEFNYQCFSVNQTIQLTIFPANWPWGGFSCHFFAT